MNTLLLVTKSNLSGMIKFAEDLAARQSDPNLGKLLVMGGSYLEASVMQKMGQLLEPHYETVELSAIQLSENTNPESQLASMVGIFLMQRYTTAPGGWLVVDSGVEISQDNPLTVIQHHFNANSTENAGRATTLKGGRVPVGPLVIGAPVKKIATLRSVSGQDWRQRGRWAFHLCSWYQFTPDEFPFRMVVEIDKPADSTEEVPASKVVKAEVTPRQGAGMTPVAMPEVYKEGTAEDMVQKVAMASDRTPQEVFKERLQQESDGVPVPGDEGYIPPVRESTPAELASIPPHPADSMGDAPPTQAPTGKKPKSLPFVRVDASAYEKVSVEVLRDQLAHRSGKKVHPMTKEPKLIAKLRKLDELAAAGGGQ